jgi:Ras-like protein family protein 11A
VYSITDRNSFTFVRKAKEALAVADPEATMPLALVGNKADMIHLRQISTEEGEILAKDFECWFSEVTAAEQVYFMIHYINDTKLFIFKIMLLTSINC